MKCAINFQCDRSNCSKKKGIVIRNVDHISMANLTFYLISPRFLYFNTVHSNKRLYIVLSAKKKKKLTESSKYYTYYWALTIIDFIDFIDQLSCRYQPTDTNDRLD